MKEGFFIRDYSSSDYSEVVQLWESLGLGGVHRGDNEQAIEKTLEMGGRLLLIIEDASNIIVGTSWLTIDGRRTYLHHFGIHTSFQNKGLAKMLLDASLQVAKSFGMQIKLEVHKDNAKALGLYSKAGFKYLGDYLVYIIRDISGL
jgi:ribosomal protein S18 acetylase RimI-like enzyme